MNDTFVPPVEPAAAPPRRSTLKHWIVIVILFAALSVSVLLNVGLLLIVAGESAFSGIEAGGGKSKFDEERVSGRGRNKVVRIDMFGIITLAEDESVFLTQQGTASRVLDEIENAERDPDVVAILLVVDSPGGGVTASDVIYDRLLKFKDSRDGARKVVALMRDLAASGGYYVSAAADKIVAHRTTITGSIGVLLSALNFKQLGDKVGITDVTIKSGKNKDLLNPLREPSTEQTNMLQVVVDDLYERFVSIVARSRGMDTQAVRKLADGRIYTATQALELGLIDEIGYEDDALDALKELTGLDNFRLIRYKRASSFLEALMARVRPGLQLPLPPQWQSRTPRLQYLWYPEL